jgi:hypothetical protein
MEESIAHYYNTNILQYLNAAATAQVNNNDKIKKIYHRIDEIT